MFGPAVVRFHVAYRERNEAAFKPLPALGSAVTTATAARFVGRPGQTYIFKVSAEDAGGHIGAPAVARTVVPVDDGGSRYKLYAGRWERVAGDRFYLGGEHQSREAGAAFTYNFDGRRVYLIGSKGPDRGQAEVVLDGASYGLIDLYAAEASARRVLWASPLLKPIGFKPHRLRVIVTGTDGRPLVGVDAVARVK